MAYLSPKDKQAAGDTNGREFLEAIDVAERSIGKVMVSTAQLLRTSAVGDALQGSRVGMDSKKPVSTVHGLTETWTKTRKISPQTIGQHVIHRTRMAVCMTTTSGKNGLC
jgi:hypothetical protein